MLIELKNVSVKLGGRQILENINLKLTPGQITAIVGPSGCGLSVLLKIAAGLIPPSSGQILYDGRQLESFPEDELRKLQTRTGFMFQDAALWANQPLFANFDLPLQAKYPQMDAEERKNKINTSLQQFGFSVDTQKRPADISLGQKKFASFLRAVIPGPEALLLDEPVAGMDRIWADRIWNELSSLKASGTTIALTSNQHEEDFELADSLVFLKGGRITETPTT